MKAMKTRLSFDLLLVWPVSVSGSPLTVDEGRKAHRQVEAAVAGAELAGATLRVHRWTKNDEGEARALSEALGFIVETNEVAADLI